MTCGIVPLWHAQWIPVETKTWGADGGRALHFRRERERAVAFQLRRNRPGRLEQIIIPPCSSILKYSWRQVMALSGKIIEPESTGIHTLSADTCMIRLPNRGFCSAPYLISTQQHMCEAAALGKMGVLLSVLFGFPLNFLLLRNEAWLPLRRLDPKGPRSAGRLQPSSAAAVTR